MIEYLISKLYKIQNARLRKFLRGAMDAAILFILGFALLSIYQAYAKMQTATRTIEMLHENNDKLRKENRLLENEIVSRLKKIEKP